ncbi:MAG: hypothetical protein QF752_06590 [Planctomycetota bacterium]|nr:hypothetical protein [Planctomycetota bacterium]
MGSRADDKDLAKLEIENRRLKVQLQAENQRLRAELEANKAKPAEEPVAEAKPAEEPVAEAKPAEEPVAEAKPEDEVEPKLRTPVAELAKLAGREKVRAEQMQVIVGHMVKSARKAKVDFEYSKARGYLMQALKLDPNNKEALDLLAEIGMILGERKGELKSLSEFVRDEALVRRQQARKSAENLFKEGEGFYGEQKYEQAIEKWERVLEIIRWAPYELNLGTLKERSDNYIELAQRKQVLHEKWLEQKRLQKAREDAVREEKVRQARSKARIRLLFLQAIDHFNRKRYEEAELLARDIVEIDPANEDARRMIVHSIDARHERAEAQNMSGRIEQWKRFQEDMKESMTPYADILRFPDREDWKLIDRRTGSSRTFEEITAPESKEIRETKEKLLSQTISLEFDETPFEEVIEFIQNYSDINIAIRKSVKDKLAEEDTPITLKVTDLKLTDALDVLLGLNDFEYTIGDNGILFITTKDSEFASGKSSPRLHDVRDLVVKITDFPGPKIQLAQGEDDGGGTGALFGDDDDDQDDLTQESIVELIQQTIATKSWDEDKFSIQNVGGQLLVVHSPAVHAQIDDFLNSLRRSSRMMVTVEARFLTVTDDFLQFIGVDMRGLGAGGGENSAGGVIPFMEDIDANQTALLDNQQQITGGTSLSGPSAGLFFQPEPDHDVRLRTESIVDRTLGNRQNTTGGLSLEFAILDEEQSQYVLRAVQKTTKATTMTAPRITVYNTQRANVTVVNQISYVRDFDVSIATASAIADPIIGTLQDGLVLDVRPTVSHDRRYVTLELRPTVSQLNSADVPPNGFRNQTTSLGTTGGTGFNQTVTIEIPNLIVQTVETTVRVPDRGSVIIGGLKTIRVLDSKTGVPWLSNIPMASFIASGTGKSDEMQNVIIIVKATVVDLDEEQERQVGERR